MASLSRQEPYTPIPAARVNEYATEIERVVTGTFGDLTNTTRPICVVARTSTLSVLNNTETLIPWQSADDPHGMWDPGTPTLLTITTPGIIGIVSQLRYGGSVGGSGRINKMSVTNDAFAAVIAETVGAPRSNGTAVQCSRTRRFTAGEPLYQWGSQDSGGSLNLQLDVGGCWLALTWLGP